MAVWPSSSALVTTPVTSVLDLDECVGQRSATFVFYLVDGVTGENKGEIHPLRDRPARLSHSADRTIPRTLNLLLGNTDTLLLDPVRDRILPYMRIGGADYPLGRYMASDPTSVLSTGGYTTTVQCVDEMFRIDQKISGGFTAIGSVMSAVLDLLATVLDPPVIKIEASGFGATGGWSIGAGRGQILDALTTQGDYLRPWIDNSGAFRMVRTFDPARAVPTFDFDLYKRVLRESIAVSNDLLDAPNRFIVTSNSGGKDPISASSDIPNNAPHSIPNRGFVVVQTTDIQLTSQGQAQAIADGLSTTAVVLERATLSTPPDPRHDGWDVILWQGVNWLETGWSMECVEGGEMVHNLRRAYT